jgi:hypothetical protein
MYVILVIINILTSHLESWLYWSEEDVSLWWLGMLDIVFWNSKFWKVAGDDVQRDWTL